LHLGLRITSPKLGCGEGSCGACTVIISQCIDQQTGDVEHRTVNACLIPLCAIDGCHVITVEGLGSVEKSNLHSAQARLADMFGSQCGFCSPGIVMSLYGTITSKSDAIPTMQDIEDGFDGNLCRCTGYRSILDAGKTFACDINKLPEQQSIFTTTSRTSTTLDKCLLFTKENTSLMNQIEFPEKLRGHIFEPLHIKGIRAFYFHS
jgi:xanthine dehydrogenase iron-sulfur cluster and FAD-binding subunit A